MTKFLRMPQVVALTGLQRGTIYSLIRKNAFPAQVKISERCSAWREDELDNWMRARIGPRSAGLATLAQALSP